MFLKPCKKMEFQLPFPQLVCFLAGFPSSRFFLRIREVSICVKHPNKQPFIKSLGLPPKKVPKFFKSFVQTETEDSPFPPPPTRKKKHSGPNGVVVLGVLLVYGVLV